jgi:hypothetical protein
MGWNTLEIDVVCREGLFEVVGGTFGADPFDWSWVCSLVQAVVSSLA